MKKLRLASRLRISRPGKTIVLVVILLPALLGMVGLVIDGGLMMAAHRRTHNAADAAAMAAAMELYRGSTPAVAIQVANTFVKQHNAMSNATVDVRIPPTTGPHSGQNRYVEVLVSHPTSTLFIHVLGGSQNQSVQTRAVAGYEAVAYGEGAIVLDPNARPGLDVQGGAILRVDGTVIDNARGAGYNQYGTWMNTGYQQYALVTSNNSLVLARHIHVAGGVDVPSNYKNFDPSGPNPLFCGAPIAPDPLRELPVPTQANTPSITDWTRKPAMTINSGQTVTIDPGVYEDIQVNQGATLNLNPGVYVLSPTKPNQGFRANGDCTIIGKGVMIYSTGTSYLDGSPGYWDSADGHLDGPLPPTNGPDQLPPPPDPGFNKVRFASVTINATNAYVNLSGLDAPGTRFHDVLFFHRRRNSNDVNIQGNAGEEVFLGGTMYAKWARFKLAGGGRYDAQFVVGSMSVSGQATVIINATGNNFGKANQVFLVE